MPTGYTAPVYEGKDYTPKELANRFARVMGVAIMQRDDSLDVPLKDREASTYYQKSLGEAEQELADFNNKTDDELATELDEEIDSIVQYNKELRAKNRAMTERYDEAITWFTEWKPQSDVGKSTKKFALEQLNESKSFDCRDYQRPVPQHGTVTEYRRQRLAELERKVEHYRDEWRKEQERAEEFNQAIRDLKADIERLP